MKRALPTALVIAAALAGCGPTDNGPPDGGPDESCGTPRLDCTAQKRYGLILQRCFEYEDAADPGTLALGALVNRIWDIEQGRMVIEVEYLTGGQRRMVDHFFFEGQDLSLARREWVGSGSVTYRDSDEKIVGVPIWQVGTANNQSFERVVQSDVSGQLSQTTFKVSTTLPSPTERGAAEFVDSALALLVTETQVQRMDSRRVFADGKGFTSINTTLISQGGSSAPTYRLMSIRDVGSAAGGNYPCSFTQ